jgi:hypothetical protein
MDYDLWIIRNIFTSSALGIVSVFSFVDCQVFHYNIYL